MFFTEEQSWSQACFLLRVHLAKPAFALELIGMSWSAVKTVLEEQTGEDLSDMTTAEFDIWAARHFPLPPSASSMEDSDLIELLRVPAAEYGDLLQNEAADEIEAAYAAILDLYDWTQVATKEANENQWPEHSPVIDRAFNSRIATG